MVEPHPLCPMCGTTLDLNEWQRRLPNPLRHAICACRAIHVDHDDVGGSGLDGTPVDFYAVWRAWWVRFGMPWLHDDGRKPAAWNPLEQLRRIGVDLVGQAGAPPSR